MDVARAAARLRSGEEFDPGEPESDAVRHAIVRSPSRVWRCELEICLEEGDQALLESVDHRDLVSVALRFERYPSPAKVVSFAVLGGRLAVPDPGEERHVEILSPEQARIVDGRGNRCDVRNQAALVLYVVARSDGRASWLSCAKAIWGRSAEDRRDNFRNNVLYRLDKTLRAQGMRDDLTVRVDGMVSFGSGVTWSFSPPARPR